MRTKSSTISPVSLPGLALACMLVCNTASAQNFVKNPGFEEELGPDNRTIVFAPIVHVGTLAWPKTCTATDFFVLGRTRMSHKDLSPGTWDGDPNYWNKFGLHFQAGHDWLMHAYASQVVSNLVPGASYTASAWITQYEGDQTGKVLVYMETLGGDDGTVTNQTPYVTTTILNNAAGWNRYELTNTASTRGTIEIRLHYEKYLSTAEEKWRNMIGIFDNVCLRPTGQQEYQPAYDIASLSRSSQEVSLTWDTVMNNSYRLQYSTNLGASSAWSWIPWSPSVDYRLHATGPSLTFRTNLASLFASDPLFNPNAPLFFRVFSQSFNP